MVQLASWIFHFSSSSSEEISYTKFGLNQLTFLLTRNCYTIILTAEIFYNPHCKNLSSLEKLYIYKCQLIESQNEASQAMNYMMQAYRELNELAEAPNSLSISQHLFWQPSKYKEGNNRPPSVNQHEHSERGRGCGCWRERG